MGPCFSRLIRNRFLKDYPVFIEIAVTLYGNLISRQEDPGEDHVVSLQLEQVRPF